MQPWVIKYQPTRLEDVAGNKEALKRIDLWFKTWKPGKKALLLVGPPGVGKTTAAVALAKEHGLDLLEMNASDTRNKAGVSRIVGLASQYGSLFSSGRLILIDEVDGMNRYDRGGTTELVKILKQSQYPIILTANDDYATPVRAIKQYVEVVKFKKVNSLTIKSVLKRIASAEGIDVDESIVDKIAKNADGDLKSAINDLQAVSEGEKKVGESAGNLLFARDRQQDVFQALKIIFKTESFKTAKSAVMNLDLDPDMLKAWIDENISNEYENMEEVAEAYYWLSRADIFSGRIIRRQNWSLLSYVLDFMTAGVALSKNKMYRKFTRYQFPQSIMYLSRTKATRQIEYSLARKIGAKIHASQNEVMTEYLPYIREMVRLGKLNVSRFSEYFDLSDSEISLLRD